MVKIAIRDDDANFFTKIEDLELVYPKIDKFPVSFAVVPMITDVLGGCPETKGNSTPRDIRDNKDLVSWLRQKVELGECDVLLHGLTHEYKFDSTGNKIPEMIWRSGDEELENQLSEWKSIFHSLFGCAINCFVAPCNRISKDALKVVSKTGLNYSGIVPISFDRDYTIKNICNYIKRFTLRAITGLPFPGVMDYSDHKEINACELRSLDYLVKMYKWCDKHKQPLVVNVHYWDLRDNSEQLITLMSFMDFCEKNGCVPTTVSSLLSK